MICDTNSGKRLKDATAHAGEISALAFGANGKLVATAGKTDEQVRVWDDDGKRSSPIPWFPTPVTVLAFSADGTKLLASCQPDASFRGRHRRGIDARMPMEDQCAAAFTVEGHVVALADTILAWKPEKDAKVQRIETAIDLSAMALTPDGRRVLVGGRDGSLALYRLEDGRLSRPSSVPGPVHSLSIAPDAESYSVITETQDGRRMIGSSKADLSDSIFPPAVKPQ